MVWQFIFAHLSGTWVFVLFPWLFIRGNIRIWKAGRKEGFYPRKGSRGQADRWRHGPAVGAFEIEIGIAIGLEAPWLSGGLLDQGHRQGLDDLAASKWFPRA
jgi:hypothetical protein